MISQVVYGILWAATIWTITVIAKWWKAHKDEESVQSGVKDLQEWAAIAVRAAKDLGVDVELSGENKRLYCQRVLGEMRDKLGLDDITDEQIEMLVRHAYTVMMEESLEVSIPDYDEDEEDDFLDDGE